MQVSGIRALREDHWFKPIEGCDLEVCIRPSAYQTIWTLTDTTNMQTARHICKAFFVNLRHVHDGEKPVENTIDNRIELHTCWEKLRQSMFTEAGRLNSEAAQGEEGAGSD